MTGHWRVAAAFGLAWITGTAELAARSHPVRPAFEARGCGDARHQRRHPPSRHPVVVDGQLFVRAAKSMQGAVAAHATTG